jgi:predicted metal-dependent HD superfamily phosphohydrolase
MMTQNAGYNALAEEVQQYVLDFFREHANEKIVYHDLAHTQAVVAAAIQIANHYGLNDHDFFIVLTAAWFHDLGYFTDASIHEEEGAALAATYLQQKNIDEEIILAVKNCILATKMPQQPHNLLEEIICDADLFHLGTDEFAERNKLMRKEYAGVFEKEIPKDEWRIKTIKLLESHHYHTDYCRLLLNEKKEKNLDTLKRKEEKKSQEKNEETLKLPITGSDEEPKAKEIKEKAKKENRPERGIETMFRISSGNHQKLSDQADSKSHILITVNSIIISVLLSILLKSLDQYPQLRIPAYLLLFVNLITIILAILATRPAIPGGTFTQNDLDEKKVNLLFFGNFYRMSLQDYASGMIQMMNDREFLYGSLIRDVYSQGVVLGRKYRMLRAAYNVFMFGLIISVIAFVIASVIS